MALTYVRRKLSSTAREQLYDRCRGDNEFPDCNICHQPVLGFREAWDESHDPDGNPHAIDGNDDTGVAHRACNRRHNNEVATPLVAKVKRIRQKAIGAFQTRHKMPGGRDSRIKKKIGGGVVARQPRVAKLSFADLDAQLAAVAVEMACPAKLEERSGVRP